MPENILIFGRDPDIRNCLAEVCDVQGYQLTWAETGEEGLAAVEGGSFNAVVLEGVLPDIDGDILLNILIEAYPRLPVILFTASLGTGSTKAKEELMRRGVFSVVSMPWDRKVLSLIISEAMKFRTSKLSPTRPSFKEDIPNIRAHGLIRHFDRVYAKFGKYKFKFGGEIAREWLRLINKRAVSEAEVASLVAIVNHGRWWGTGWSALAYGVHKWARSMELSGVDYNAGPEHPPEEPKENGLQAISALRHQ